MSQAVTATLADCLCSEPSAVATVRHAAETLAPTSLTAPSSMEPPRPSCSCSRKPQSLRSNRTRCSWASAVASLADCSRPTRARSRHVSSRARPSGPRHAGDTATAARPKGPGERLSQPACVRCRSTPGPTSAQPNSIRHNILSCVCQRACILSHRSVIGDALIHAAAGTRRRRWGTTTDTGHSSRLGDSFPVKSQERTRNDDNAAACDERRWIASNGIEIPTHL